LASQLSKVLPNTSRMAKVLHQICAVFILSASWQVCVSPIELKSERRVEQETKLNDRPIIAVLTQHHRPLFHNQSYLAASYVKYLESSGARVVAIPHHFTESQVKELFGYVNGFLMPGGGVKYFTSDYYKHAKVFWDLAIKANDEGNFFPIWGTCMGFEVMHVLQANEIVTDTSVSNDKALALDFLEGARKSRLLKGAPDDLFKIISKEKVTWNHHSQGIRRQRYEHNKKLSNFFNILSVNIDEDGKEFISTVEAKKYPFYGVQWHPEKNNFEHRTIYKEFPNSANGVRTSQYMANFFVNEARKNQHRFPTQQMEDKYLIYNYTPVKYDDYSIGTLSHFEQVYVFEG